MNLPDPPFTATQQAVDIGAIVVFILTLANHLPHVMASIGSTLGVCWYLYLFYKEYKNKKKK